MTKLATIRIEDSLGGDRRRMVSVGVPFKPGDWDGSGELEAEGALIAHRDIRRWADGSVRWCALDILSEKTGDLEIHAAMGRPLYRIHPGMAEMNGTWQFRPQGDDWYPVAIESLGTNGVVKSQTVRWRERRSGAWMNIEIRWYSGSIVARYRVEYGWSTDLEPGVEKYLHGFKIEYHRVLPSVHLGRVVPDIGLDAQSMNLVRGIMTIHNPAAWGDSQANWVEGYLLFQVDPALASDQDVVEAAYVTPTSVEPTALCLDWPERPHLSPTGTLPPSAPTHYMKDLVDKEAARMADSMCGENSPHRDNPWRRTLTGPDPYPGRAGDQPDFGVHNQWAFKAACSGSASMAWFVALEAKQEFCRPVNLRERNGQPVRHESRPDMWMWDSRPHFDRNVSPDRFGKNEQIDSSKTLGYWVGRDRQHSSVNQPTQAALLTGDPALLDWCDQEVERFLASYPVRHASEALEDTLPPRQTRSYQAAAMLYWVTDREDLMQRFSDRASYRMRKHFEEGGGDTKPRDPRITVVGPVFETRRFQTHWVPWEVGEYLRSMAVYQKALENTGIINQDIGEMMDVYSGGFLDGWRNIEANPDVAWWLEINGNDGDWGAPTHWAYGGLQVMSRMHGTRIPNVQGVPGWWKL